MSKLRRPRAGRRYQGGGNALVSRAKSKSPTAPPKPPTPAAPPRPTAPPETLQSASDRIDLSQDYGLTMSQINRQLMEAALRFGGAPSTQQFGLGPGGQDTATAVPVTTNPGDASAWSNITRNLTEANKQVDETSNARNTFFSSKRIGDLQDNSNEAARARQQALAEYQSHVSDLVSQLLGARNARESGWRGANIADIMASQELPAPAAVPQSGPPAPKPKPKKGFQFVQSKGSRKGMSYNLVPGPDGKLWRRYENGNLIPR